MCPNYVHENHVNICLLFLYCYINGSKNNLSFLLFDNVQEKALFISDNPCFTESRL